MTHPTIHFRIPLFFFVISFLFQVLLTMGLAAAPAFAMQFVEVFKETVLVKADPARTGMQEQPAVTVTGGRKKRATHHLLLSEDSVASAIDASDTMGQPTDKGPGSKLVLDCMLRGPEDMQTLELLADKIYRENTGQSYENVTIVWHIGTSPEMAAPWARTTVIKASVADSVLQ